jgi:hypothetical protein
MEDTNTKKPFVMICANCQKHFPEVDAQVKKHEEIDDVAFSHAVCRNHMMELLKGHGIPQDKIDKSIAKLNAGGGKSAPDLREHPDLVKMYSQGIFTPEDLENHKQLQLKELLQRRANIIPS